VSEASPASAQAVDAVELAAPSQGIPSPDGWLRLSPRALAVRPITDLLRTAPVLIGLLFAGMHGGHLNYWGLGFGALAILTGIWRWFGTKYQVSDDRVYVKHGLLSPRVLSTPRSGVRSVDLTAHVMYRLLGVARVKIGTGRNDKREGENFHLDAIDVTAAETLRTLLLATPRGAEHVATAETEIVRLRMSWVRYAPLTMTGLVILGVLVGFVTQAEHDAGVSLAALGAVHSGIHVVTRMPLGESIPVGVLTLVVGLVLVSMLGYIGVFWNFRLVRTGASSLRVTRGLLSTRATTIDETRLRGVEISEPLSLRAAKGARLIAITTGLRVGGGAERGGSVLLPPAPRIVADRVAAEILGVPAELSSIDLVPHGRAALRRRHVRALVPICLLYIALLVTLLALDVRLSYWLAVIALFALIVGVLLARDRYRGLGHQLSGDWIVLSTGSLVRRRSILNVRGVIGWQLRQTWFQRRRDLVTVTVTTAAGKQRYSAADMPMAEALAFITAATPDLVPPFLS
jgi:putative membrane protein